MAEMTSLTADEVIGRSLYQFCHVNDLTTLRHAHVEGSITTSCRLLHSVVQHSYPMFKLLPLQFNQSTWSRTGWTVKFTF